MQIYGVLAGVVEMKIELLFEQAKQL